jgi:pimeloyl-ACP methyl ester carboxylesterase
MFMTPGRPADRARREQELFDRGEKLSIPVWGQTARGLRWGSGPRILVQHGWGSRSTAMWAIISRLIEEGFEVIAFDAIGNGDSDGDESSMLHFAETLSEASVHFGPFYGVVGHSIGASAIPLALTKELRAEKVILISARDDLQHFLTRFLELIEADPAHFEPVRQIWDQVIGWDRVMAATPSRIASTLELPALIIHDKEDEDVPFVDSEQLHSAWKDSEIQLTNSFGHVRIVRSKEVAEMIAKFLLCLQK